MGGGCTCETEMLVPLQGQRITPLCSGLKRLGTTRMLLSLDPRRCVLPVPNKVLYLPPLCRYPDSGADLPGQGPVCQAGAGGGSSRRGSHGDRDPEFHHQGMPGCWALHSGQSCRSSRREPGPDSPADSLSQPSGSFHDSRRSMSCIQAAGPRAAG